MSTTEKILQTMNSWQSGEVIAVRRKKCSWASSHPNVGGTQDTIFYKWASVKKTLTFHLLLSTLFWLEESVLAVLLWEHQITPLNLVFLVVPLSLMKSWCNWSCCWLWHDAARRHCHCGASMHCVQMSTVHSVHCPNVHCPLSRRCVGLLFRSGAGV